MLGWALENYDPKDPSKTHLYFNLIMITQIIVPVLSVLDVAYILGVNYQKRENPILPFVVVTHITFAVLQYLTFLKVEKIRGNLFLINAIFWVIYFIFSGFAFMEHKDEEDPTPSQPIRVGADKFYCGYKFSTYSLSFIALTRALGPYEWNWLLAFFPLTLLYIGVIVAFFAVLFYAIYAVCKSGERATVFALVAIPGALLLFLTPCFLWVYFLNEFEKTGAKRVYIAKMVWVLLFLVGINAVWTVRIRKYIANDELRNAIMRRQRLQAAARQGQSTTDESSNHIEKVGTALKYLPVGGNYFRRQESNVEALTRKKTITGSNEENLCIVCFAKQANTIYLPCKHGGVCETCSREIFEKTGSCPLCRKKIERIVVFEKKNGQMIKKADIM